MGSFITRKAKKNEREASDANMRVTFLGCYGIHSGSLAFESSETLTSSSFSCKNNGTRTVATHLTEKSLSDEIDKGKGQTFVDRYSHIEDEFEYDNIEFSNFSYSQSLVSRSIPSTPRTTSSGTFQDFVPTPLTQVLPQLYLGSEHDAQQAEKLNGLGITHIISIVGGGRYKDLYPKHMYIPLRDNGSSDLLEKINNSYDFAMESQEPGNKLFIHCQLGQNRSPSYVIGFLMKSKNLTFFAAYTLVKEKRELIHPHKKYIEQLRHFDLELHKVHSIPKDFLDIALCSKEGIKIMHHNFSKADSEGYKILQIRNSKEDAIDLSSVSSPQSQVRSCDMVQLCSIYLPDCDDSQSISEGKSLTPSSMRISRETNDVKMLL